MCPLWAGGVWSVTTPLFQEASNDDSAFQEDKQGSEQHQFVSVMTICANAKRIWGISLLKFLLGA